MLVKRLLQVAAAGLSFSSVKGSDNPDDPTGTVIYVTDPACDHYRCVVTWTHGQHVAVNWINPPANAPNVSIQLASNTNLPTYTVIDSMPSVTDNCDAGQGVGVPVQGTQCGRFEFDVPNDWVVGDDYTIAVTDLSDYNVAGYTDAITIANTAPPANQKRSFSTGYANTTVAGSVFASAASLPSQNLAGVLLSAALTGVSFFLLA